jgi:hypothetical protein
MLQSNCGSWTDSGHTCSINACFPQSIMEHFQSCDRQYEGLSLSLVSDHHWINQSHCRTARQYLKELAVNNSLKKVNDQATAVIQSFITHVVSQHYKSLTYFKVGAIHLHGVDGQYDLMGALNCDYHEDINKKVPAK